MAYRQKKDTGQPGRMAGVEKNEKREMYDTEVGLFIPEPFEYVLTCFYGSLKNAKMQYSYTHHQ